MAFGPHPRDYRQATPKKMRQLALKCILSSKMRDGEIKVLENLHFDEPKTKEMYRILNVLGINSKALIVDSNPELNMIKSANNLSGIKTLPANLLNTVDLLSYKVLVMTEEGLRKAEELWAKQAPEEVKHASV